MAIQHRRGSSSELNVDRLVPGEFAVNLDNKKVFMCFAPGDAERVLLQEDEDKIEAELTILKQEAEEIKKTTETYKDLSKSYAVGGTGKREGEDTDNSKYYKDMAENIFAVDIKKLKTEGLVDTYEITYNNSKKVQFTVTNGSSGKTIIFEFNSPISEAGILDVLKNNESFYCSGFFYNTDKNVYCEFEGLYSGHKIGSETIHFGYCHIKGIHNSIYSVDYYIDDEDGSSWYKRIPKDYIPEIDNAIKDGFMPTSIVDISDLGHAYRYYTTGQIATDNKYIATTELYPIKNGETVIIKVSHNLDRVWIPITFYNESKQYVSNVSGYVTEQTFTATADGYYSFSIYNANGIEKSNLKSLYVGLKGRYAKSNVELTQESIDLKMLGYTLPKECPIQNSVSGNQFIQRVGRVDLGSLTYTYDRDNNRFICNNASNIKSSDRLTKMYALGYECKYNGERYDGTWNNVVYTATSGSATNLYIHNHSYTDVNTFKSAISGKYLYYELANPITMDIDGNEANISNVYGTSDMWASKTSWSKDEICISDNKLWKCLISNSNKPSEGTQWTKISLKSLLELKKQYVTYNGVGFYFAKTPSGLKMVKISGKMTEQKSSSVGGWSSLLNSIPSEFLPTVNTSVTVLSIGNGLIQAQVMTNGEIIWLNRNGFTISQELNTEIIYF